MNATAYILRSLERGPSTRRGLLNELPPIPNANVRFHRALRSLERKGAIHRVRFPEGYALGAARGCPCRDNCCDDPDPVPLDLYLRDAGAEPVDIEGEYQWWWYCRHCKSRCNCKLARLALALAKQVLTWDEGWLANAVAHAGHGWARLEGGPVGQNCLCSATKRQRECAAAGCGFCIAASERVSESVRRT